MGMGRRTKIVTEYRQTGIDADGDNIVGMGTLPLMEPLRSADLD